MASQHPDEIGDTATINEQLMEQLSEILTTIETKHKIKILYACETGSRAWGFPSPDSDYDVRFIYMNQPDWYLSLSEQKDSIEHMDGNWDITGWDLRKTLLLLKKSNAALIERFQSPIVYSNTDGFRQKFNSMIKDHYNPVAVFFHYHSLCYNFWDDIKAASEVKLKSLMYIIRSLLCCQWALQDSEVLPMEIKPLLKYVPKNVKQRIAELIRLKAGESERYLHPKDDMIYNWIAETMQMLEDQKSSVSIRTGEMKQLTQFFLKMWHGTNNNR